MINKRQYFLTVCDLTVSKLLSLFVTVVAVILICYGILFLPIFLKAQNLLT